MSELVNYKKLVLLAGFASVSTAIILIIMKFSVWMVSGSSSILASLMDSTIDLGASFVNLQALRFALKPADRDHRFGHYKAEALASLCQAAFIGGSAFFLIMHGIERLKSPRELANLDIGVYVSIASIVITFILVSFQAYVYKRTKSEAIGADRYHYLSDVLLNLGVIASLCCSMYGYLWADGLFAILLGLYIFRGALHIGRTAVSTLLDRSMTAAEHEQVLKAILSVNGVSSIHDLRTRRAGPCCFIQCHLVLRSDMPLIDAHRVATAAEDAVRALFPEADIIMHMEPDEDETYRDVKFIDDTVCHVDWNAIKDSNKPWGPGDGSDDSVSAHDVVSDTDSTVNSTDKERKD